MSTELLTEPVGVVGAELMTIETDLQGGDVTQVVEPEVEASAPVRMPVMEQKELVRWDGQVGSRSRKQEAGMFGLVAYSVSASVRRIEFEGVRPLLPLGSMTHFTLLRRWKNQGKDGRLVVIRFSGYKAYLTEEGKITLGGPEGMVCAYDLKYRPFPGASPGGVIIDAAKRTTARVAMDLDVGVEGVVHGVTSTAIRLTIPTYYAGFNQHHPVEVEETVAVRRAVLEALRPSYAGPVPACVKSQGGVVTEVHREDGGPVFIAYGEEAGMVDELPATAVLRPFVRPGVEIEPGTVIADIAPRAVYATWEQFKRSVGDDNVAPLVKAILNSKDFVHKGLRLRDVRFCPGQLLDATQIFEEPPMVDMEGRSAVQVIPETGQGRNGLVFEEGPISVDLVSLRNGWDRKFN